MRNLKKSLSLILALALLVSSVFVGGITATAANELASTTNTYDDPEGYGLEAGTYDNQPVILSGNSVTDNGDGTTTTNYETYYYFGAYGATVAQDPLNTEADKAVYFDRAKAQSNAWPAYTRIYNGGTANYSAFKAKANTTYEISLYYYSASTPAAPVNLQVRQHTGTRYINITHSDTKVLIPDLVTVSSATEGWTKVTGRFTTGDTAQYLFLMLTSTTGSAVGSGVSVYVDDVQVNECAELTVYNYDGVNEHTVYASERTTIAELDIPERDGYILTGVYSDAELANKLNASDLALNYAETGLYYGWAKLNPGEYYAGFESYELAANTKSYDSKTTSIVSGNTYAGGYNLKINAAENALNSFELRDKTAFETKAGTKYVVSFRYKATAAAKLYAGTAVASDVPGTATAIQGADLPAADDWTAASLEVTLNKGQLEGYVPVLMVQTTDAAVVEFDHIYMTYPVEETVNIENKFVTSKDWYPVLRNPDEILPEEEPIDYWTGETELPADSDKDGVFEIDTPEKLAYAIYNGGTVTLEDGTVVESASFILTKDIYLNELSKYDWSSFTRLPRGQTTLKEWYNTDTDGAAFSGTIDGNYHSVYGLYSCYDWTATWAGYDKGRGFIPSVANNKTATVKNLNLDCVYVQNEVCGAGAMVGVNYGTASFENCSVGAKVYVKGSYAGAYVGTNNTAEGVVINRCSSLATLNAHNDAETTAHLSGLSTNNWMSSGGKIIINDSYNANGCLAAEGGVIKNSYATANGSVTAGVIILTKEQMQGKDVLKINGSMPLLNVNGNYWTATKTYPVLTASLGLEVVDLGIWDGTYTTAPVDADGDGTYEINTAEEFAYVIYNGGAAGATYKLTKNIFLNNLDLINWETGETAAGYTPNPWFKNEAVQGTIDGNGYTVYGLYYNDGSTQDEMAGATTGVGLIPRVANNTTLTLKRIGVDYMFIHFKNGASPFVGYIGGNTTTENYAILYIDQCYSGENAYVTGYAGVFCGYVKGAKPYFTNSYSLAKIYSKPVNFNPENTRFTGNSWALSATESCYYNCYNAVGCVQQVNYTNYQKISGRNYAAGWNEDKTDKGEGYSAWHATRRTVENMKGLDALTASTKMPNLNKDADGNDTGLYTATESFPVLTAFVGKFYVKPVVEEEETPEEDVEDDVITPETPESYEVWDGTSVAPTVGDGSPENPWQITTGAELHYIIKNGGGAGVCYQLQNDIYLNDVSKVNWFTGSIANGYTVKKWMSGSGVVFDGILDGNGYGVYGIYIQDGKIDYSSTPIYATGLIPRTAAGGNVTVKNLNVDYMFTRYDSISGPIIGSVHSANATIDSCFVGQNVYSDSSYVGNLVGYVYGSGITLNVNNCYSLSSGYANTGHYAFIGYTHWTYVPNINLVNCYNAGGRMISENRSTFTATNCYEAADGGLNTGVTPLTNMKGADALENSMAGIKRFYKSLEADFAVVNANNFVYLPAGTILEEDFAPLFFDNRMAPLSADDVMFADRMIRGAYVKFEKAVDVTKIHVPASKAHRVTFGTAQELLSAGYFDLETEVISENLAGQPDTAVNYVFITDPHFDTQGDVGPISPQHSAKQYALAIQMANEMEEIDFVALGGDLTNGGYGSSEAWINALNGYLAETNNCTKPVFILVGNHDDNAYGSISDSVTHEAFSAKIISPDEWQSTIIDQFVNRTLEDGTEIKVSQNVDPFDNSKVNSKYYYYDLDKKNTRVICLNASDYDYAYDENGEFTLINNSSTSVNVRSNTYNGYNFWGYSKYQMKWLAEDALGTLPEDYNVIVLSHMAITADRDGQTYVNGTVLSDIMQAYQNKTAYAHDGYGIAADYTADTGRIMSYQHGHEHVVYEKYNPAPDVWQFSSANPNPHGNLTTVMNENIASIDVMSVTEGYAYKQALGKGDTAMFINHFPVYEGDVTLDTTIDIRDLVKLNNLNNSGLVSSVMPSGDIAKMRKLIIGA